MKISFSKEEYWILNNAIFFNIDKLKEEDSSNKLIKNIHNTLHLVNSSEVEQGEVIDVTLEDILNISESLFYKIEEYNRLIIGNRTEGYPTDIYEGKKEELVNLYKKIMSIR